jgi:hypothetical protein
MFTGHAAQEGGDSSPLEVIQFFPVRGVESPQALSGFLIMTASKHSL